MVLSARCAEDGKRFRPDHNEARETTHATRSVNGRRITPPGPDGCTWPVLVVLDIVNRWPPFTATVCVAGARLCPEKVRCERLSVCDLRHRARDLRSPDGLPHAHPPGPPGPPQHPPPPIHLTRMARPPARLFHPWNPLNGGQPRDEPSKSRLGASSHRYGRSSDPALTR